MNEKMMTNEEIIFNIHKNFGCTIEQAKKAYGFAVWYLRSQGVIGDHPENVKKPEMMLIEKEKFEIAINSLVTIQKIEDFCKISPSMIYPDEILDIIKNKEEKDE